jgi:hypothetical protein
MLTLRREQISAFEQAALCRFENELVAHCRDFATRLCEIIGDEQLRVAVRSSMAERQPTDSPIAGRSSSLSK